MTTGRPMTADEVRIALEIMDEEDEKITELLDELTNACESCGRRIKDGADAGCVSCIASDVMKT